MNDKCFFDSNILIYSVDESNPEKKAIAENILSSAITGRCGTLSTQSLQEFYNVLTKKLKRKKTDTKQLVRDLSELFTIEEIKIHNIFEAIDISIQTQFSFWDSLIIAMAEQAGCSILYSEDLNNNQIIENVRIVNPFITY